MPSYTRITVAKILLEQCLEIYGPNNVALSPAQQTVVEMLVARAVAMLK